MAEALLRSLLKEAEIPAEVRSAGTLPWIGGPAHPDAVATAAAAGLDITGHEAHPLTEGLVAWADVVLAMQGAHLLHVRDIDSTADVRIVTEFDLAGSHREGIEDPIGLSRDVYERVFEEIRRCLEGFVATRTRPSPAG